MRRICVLATAVAQRQNKLPATYVTLGALRTYSTAPPLSVMSWAVDGSMQSHQRCRRRLTISERIPHIVRTIKQCAPDLVALQDSTPELAQALTAEDTITTSASNTAQDGQQQQQETTEGMERGAQSNTHYVMQNATTLQHLLTRRSHKSNETTTTTSIELKDSDTGTETLDDKAQQNSVSTIDAGHKPCVSYRLVGSVVNGKCGALQLFARTSSRWHAKLDVTGPGVTAEVSYGEATHTSTLPSVESSQSNTNTSSERPARPLRFVLTVVDLAYRGTSVALHGRMLTSPDVSLEGNPHTLTAIPTQTPSQEEEESNKKEVRHISNERPVGQLDPHRALVLDHIARSTRSDMVVGNTFLAQKESMPGYVDAWAIAGAPRGQERTTDTRAPRSAQGMSNYYYFVPSVLKYSKKKNSLNNNTATNTKEEKVTVRVGEPVPLTAVYTGVPGHFRTPHRTHTTKDTNSVTVTSSNEVEADNSEEGTASESVAQELSVPEVSGRFQRCFLRHGNAASRTHKASYPFVKRYSRIRVVVPRPFVEVTLSESEAAWHRTHRRLSRRAQRRLQKEQQEQGKEGEKAKEEEDASRTVMCSLSDQYPLLTLFT